MESGSKSNQDIDGGRVRGMVKRWGVLMQDLTPCTRGNGKGIDVRRLAYSLIRFVLFIVGPLFSKGRWMLWVFAFFILMMMANTVTAMRMEIPSAEQVIRISGRFFDTSTGYSKGALYNVGIVDEAGVRHECNCEPLGYSNCLGRSSADHKELLEQFDKELIKNNAAHKAILKWLDGKQGQVWMYPNGSLFGPAYSCYKISDNARTYRSFEQAVEEYRTVKYGIDVYILGSILLAWVIFIFVYAGIRVSIYLREGENG